MSIRPIRREDMFNAQRESKNCKDDLMGRSKKILSSLAIDQLSKKEIRKFIFQYEMFNQYPPVFLEKNINDKVIFKKRFFSRLERKEDPIALYIHLPFCRKKCTFCCYFSTTDCSVSKISGYLTYLEKEILLYKGRYIKERKIASIYWGGGTPTLLNCDQINRLAKVVKDNFSIASNAELTFEATPESITPDKLDCFLKNGFNRLSIGVQTFDDKLLKSYKRLHTRKDAINSFYLSKHSGFSHINIDLMFGLARQTVSSWKETLDIAGELSPANVTFYPYSDSYGKTIMHKSLNVFFPSTKDKLLMHVMAMEKFLEAGYIQTSPYQFISSQEYTYKHQEHKAKNGEICAFGVSGHSYFRNYDYHNQRSLVKYVNLLKKGRLPVEKGQYLNRNEQMTRFIVYGLQKTSGLNRRFGGADKNLFKKLFKISLNYVFKDELRRLDKLGLILNLKRHVSLSYKGLLYPVETALFFYSKKDKRRISILSSGIASGFSSKS